MVKHNFITRLLFEQLTRSHDKQAVQETFFQILNKNRTANHKNVYNIIFLRFTFGNIQEIKAK